MRIHGCDHGDNCMLRAAARDLFRDQQPGRGRGSGCPEKAAQTISGWGFPITAGEMHSLAQAVGEQTLLTGLVGRRIRGGDGPHLRQ